MKLRIRVQNGDKGELYMMDIVKEDNENFIFSEMERSVEILLCLIYALQDLVSVVCLCITNVG